jgi:cob(I)alamin adenosyltransferase
MKSQITTKFGDAGQTRALSGDTYSKAHPAMECVGALDELRAQTALLRLRVLAEQPADWEATSSFLFWLLHTYFVIGATCSDPLSKHPEYRTSELGQKEIEKLEVEQLRMEAQVKFPRAFIVSASNTLAAQVDITCTVARRTERALVRLTEEMPGFRPAHLLTFINRLSDYLYVLARYIEQGRHLPVDYEVLGHGPA